MIGRLPHRVKLRRRSRSGEDPRYRNEELGRVEELTGRARIDPLDATEETTNRDTSRSTYNLILGPQVDDAGRAPANLEAYDEVEWVDKNLILELDGPAQPIDDGLGRVHHYEASGFVVRR